jgi:hypothetical protein
MANQTATISRTRPSIPSLLYTLEFKNGRVLKHQDPLTLSQFRSDSRLATDLRETGSERTEALQKQERGNS